MWACYFQSGILFHIFRDQKSPNKLSWIHNDCSSGIEAEITLAYHPLRPAPSNRVVYYTLDSPYTAGSGVERAMTNRWPFIGPVVHQLFSVWPLTSNPHGECRGSAGPQDVAVVWAGVYVGKAVTSHMSHPTPAQPCSHWLTWWDDWNKMAEWRYWRGGGGVRRVGEGWMMKEYKNRKKGSMMNRRSWFFPLVDHHAS